MTVRILYVEDNEQNFYLVRFILEAQGWRVVRAHDGPSGLEAAAQGGFDLVLLDIDLPGMDGYEVARILRTIPEVAGTPIVAVTSYALSGDREKTLAAGCDDYIEKPIDPKTFAATVASLLARGEGGEGRT